VTRAEIEAAERQQRRELADAKKIARYQLALEAVVAVAYESDATVIAELALKEPQP